MQKKAIDIVVKYADIDDKPYSHERVGWVSRLVQLLAQTLGFYFNNPVRINTKKETELITETEFKDLDAVIYILSPAFLVSSNLNADISIIEKAVLFDTEYMNSKIHKVLKGPVDTGSLPVTISMGTYHYFYQTAKSVEYTYDTLLDWDPSDSVRKKYWETFTNLVFNLLKDLKHPKSERFTPPHTQSIYLGLGSIEHVWHRSGLLGELNSRGVKVFPDHDHSIEVKHLKDPVKFYLKKSNLAVHFPDEFLPLDEKKIEGLAELPWLKRFIWFDPQAEKEVGKKKLHDELKQKLKNLEHVEVINSGIEELKEIIFSYTGGEKISVEEGLDQLMKLYLLCPDTFPAAVREEVKDILQLHNLELLTLKEGKVSERRASHYRYLKEADFCLICYGGGNPEWLLANINEVKKSRGLNPDKRHKIKPGLLLSNEFAYDEVSHLPASFSLLKASSPQFRDDINCFLNEK